MDPPASAGRVQMSVVARAGRDPRGEARDQQPFLDFLLPQES